MFLVLFLVPAIIAMQLDFGRFMRALRRLIFSKRIPILYMWLVWLCLISIFVVYSLGLGSIILFGKPSQLLNDYMPSMSPLMKSIAIMVVSLIVTIILSISLGHFLSKKYRN